MSAISIGHFELVEHLLHLMFLIHLRIGCRGHLPFRHHGHQLVHSRRILVYHSVVLGSSFSFIWVAAAGPCWRCLHMLEPRPGLLSLGRHLLLEAALSSLF